MMTITTRRLALWAVAAAAAGGACGGSSGGSSVSLSAFPNAYANAICAQNFKCCSADDISGGNHSHTMSDCVNNNASALMLVSQTLSAAQTAGRVTYDAKQMGMCIDGIKQMSCDQWQKGLTDANQPAACNTAIVAKVSAGGGCTDDLECTGGTCVGADTSVTPPVMGMCVADVAIGGACTATSTCAGGFCDTTTNTCVAKKPAGEACTSDNQCTNSCNTTTGKCSCYNGCAVGPGPFTAGGALAVLGFALMGLTVSIARRRRAH
jgi:hypothetical protein